MDERLKFETPSIPPIDPSELREFFQNHRMSKENDENTFRWFQEMQALGESIDPDELVYLGLWTEGFQDRYNDVMVSRTPLDRNDAFALRKIINRLREAIWERLISRRPLEAQEIRGTAAAESFNDAYNAQSSIVKATEEVIKSLDTYKEQLRAAHTILSKKSLSPEDRATAEANKLHAEERIQRYTSILDKRQKEI